MIWRHDLDRELIQPSHKQVFSGSHFQPQDSDLYLPLETLKLETLVIMWLVDILPGFWEPQSPCTGQTMSRTDFKDSGCNHGSGCGRSVSSAPSHKLGTFRTLSLNFYSKSTSFFLFAAGNVDRNRTLWNCRRLPSTNTYTSGSLGAYGGGRGFL